MRNENYECLKESPRKVSPELKTKLKKLESDVQNLRYQKLEEYLQNGQWKEADEETYRLMKLAVGKEEEQWLDEEDLVNLPCEDLRMLNELWLSNSQGKFGFSVQKKIYESLGGTREYNYDVFKKLGDLVGWRKEENWVSYSDLYDMNLKGAKQGYLPTPPNYIKLNLHFKKFREKLSGILVEMRLVYATLLSREDL